MSWYDSIYTDIFLQENNFHFIEDPEIVSYLTVDVRIETACNKEPI